jgi:hypothetical protein
LPIDARCRLVAAGALAATLVLAPVLGHVAASGEDFAEIFGAHYDEAERFLRANRWIGRGLQLPPEDRRIALAIVFPELIRFSALEDHIQVRALKVLYVQYGGAYADFSIGRFQMKPSFAEQLELDAGRLLSPSEHAGFDVQAAAREETAATREQRVLRLDDLAWQSRYLRVFMLVMGKRYGGVAFATSEERVRFYAAAYNAGYTSGETVLRRRARERRFHTALLIPATRYCYADIAAFFFTRSEAEP